MGLQVEFYRFSAMKNPLSGNKVRERILAQERTQTHTRVYTAMAFADLSLMSIYYSYSGSHCLLRTSPILRPVLS